MIFHSREGDLHKLFFLRKASWSTKISFGWKFKVISRFLTNFVNVKPSHEMTLKRQYKIQNIFMFSRSNGSALSIGWTSILLKAVNKSVFYNVWRKKTCCSFDEKGVKILKSCKHLPPFSQISIFKTSTRTGKLGFLGSNFSLTFCTSFCCKSNIWPGLKVSYNTNIQIKTCTSTGMFSQTYFTCGWFNSNI